MCVACGCEVTEAPDAGDNAVPEPSAEPSRIA